MATTLTLTNLLTSRLKPKLGLLDNIKIHNMLCRHVSSTTAQAPYGNWKTTVSGYPLIRKNGVIISSPTYDEDTGIVTISDLDAGDDVHVDTVFSYFSDTTLNNFYKLALSRFNQTPPRSGYTFDDSTVGDTATYPRYAEDYLTQYAYKQCLDTIVMDLMQWEAFIIFRDAAMLSQILMAKSASIDAYLMSIMLTLKGRDGLSPHSVSVGKWKAPAMVNDSTWTAHTTITG